MKLDVALQKGKRVKQLEKFSRNYFLASEFDSLQRSAERVRRIAKERANAIERPKEFLPKIAFYMGKYFSLPKRIRLQSSIEKEYRGASYYLSYL